MIMYEDVWRFIMLQLYTVNWALPNVGDVCIAWTVALSRISGADFVFGCVVCDGGEGKAFYLLHTG